MGKNYTITKTNKREAVNCYKQLGPQFEDCELATGWDCCFVGAAGSKAVNLTAVVEHTEPLDCAKKYGDKMYDCERTWGWDCCLRDDYAKEVTAVSAKDDEDSDKVDLCEQQYGPKMYDCGMGYGRNCCYVDSTAQTGTHVEPADLKHPMIDIKEKLLTCAEQQWNFTDCGFGFGRDCCIIDNGKIPYHHDTHMHVANRSSKEAVDVLRNLVLMAMFAFVVITYGNRCRGVRKTLSGNRKGSGNANKRLSKISEKDDNKVELKPLVTSL